MESVSRAPCPHHAAVHEAMQFVNHFVVSFYHLPPELFNSLMQCAIASLGLQERYSMVAGCAFIVSSRLYPTSECELTKMTVSDSTQDIESG